MAKQMEVVSRTYKRKQETAIIGAMTRNDFFQCPVNIYKIKLDILFLTVGTSFENTIS